MEREERGTMGGNLRDKTGAEGEEVDSAGWVYNQGPRDLWI